MKGGSNTVSNVHTGESVIDQRNTMASCCLRVTTSYFIKYSHSIAWSLLHFNSTAQNWTKFTYFVSRSQANIVFSFDLCKVALFQVWMNPQTSKRKFSQTCHIFLTYPLTQCISLHKYEVQLWPRIGSQPLDSLSLILYHVIKLSNKGQMLMKYEKERGTERKGNEKREMDKEY